MSWPTPQDYNEAIQSPALCFKDSDLVRGEIELTPMGIPKAITGAFASVYKVNTADGDWAVRCFLTDRPDQKTRYETISKYVLMDNLKYTVEFHYLEEGIKVRSQWYPILKMNWVYGQTLEHFLMDSYRDSEALSELRDEFSELAKGLDDVGMAHGDLQHGNMILDKNGSGITLVDYDAMFVPDLLGKAALELGHPNYQHPDRAAGDYDTTVDNFSCWLIHHSLSIVALDPDLFKYFDGGDECILFRRKDLADPENSPLFEALFNHDNEEIQAYARTILRMLWALPNQVPELHHPEELSRLPDVKPIKKESLVKSAGENSEEQPRIINSVVTSYSDGTLFEQDTRLSITKNKKKYINKKATKRGVKTLLLDGATALASKLVEAQKKVFPTWWILTVMPEADSMVSRGEYQQAVELYLEIFKEVYKSRGDDFGRRNVVSVALRLSDAMTRLGNDNLATNYFYTAYRESCNYESPQPQEVATTAMLLSMNRYRKGDIEGAITLFRDELRLIPRLDVILTDNIFQNLAVLDLLCLVCDAMKDHNDKKIHRQLLSNTVALHGVLYGKTRREIDIDCAHMYLVLAAQDYESNLFEQSMKSYRKFNEIARLVIALDQGESSDPCNIDDSRLIQIFADLGQSKIDEVKVILEFCSNAEKLSEDLSFQELAQRITRLENLDKDAIVKCLEYRCHRYPKATKLNYLLKQVEYSEFPKVHNALKEVLVRYGTDIDLSVYLDDLVRSNRADTIPHFLRILIPSSDANRLVRISRTIQHDTLKHCLDSFEAPIMEAGNVSDVLQFFALSIDFKPVSYISGLCIKILEDRSLAFGLELLLEMHERGLEDLVKQVYNTHFDQNNRFYGTSAHNAEVSLFAELILRVEGETNAEYFISEFIRLNSNPSIYKLVQITGTRKTESTYYLLFIIYIKCYPAVRRLVLAELIEEELLESLDKLLYLFATKANGQALQFFTDDVVWLTTYKTAILRDRTVHGRPLHHYLAVVLEEITKIVSDDKGLRKEMSYESWCNLVRSGGQ